MFDTGKWQASSLQLQAFPIKIPFEDYLYTFVQLFLWIFGPFPFHLKKHVRKRIQKSGWEAKLCRQCGFKTDIL